MAYATQVPRYMQRSNQLTGEIREEMLDRLTSGEITPDQFKTLCKELLQAGIAGGLDLRKEVAAMAAWIKLEEESKLAGISAPVAPAAFLKILEKKQA